MRFASFLTAVVTTLGASAAAAAVPAATGSAGCGKFHLVPGLTTYHGLTSSGRDRKYSVHIPVNYSDTAPYPVVLGFHGSPGIGFFFEVDSKMSEARFSGNKIMVYPDGIGGSWAGANYSQVSVAEDVQFISDLLNQIRNDYCVDDSRIYATGMSNGGGFVDVLACDTPVGGQFAAFAPASGAYYMNNDITHVDCKPARSPVPIIEIHGGADASVNYTGGAGEGGIEPAVPAWLGWWAQRNGCNDAGKKVEDSFDGDVHHTSWTCGGTEGALQHWKVDDMPHVWASTELTPGGISAGVGPTHIEATQLIMDFFDRFTKT